MAEEDTKIVIGGVKRFGARRNNYCGMNPMSLLKSSMIKEQEDQKMESFKQKLLHEYMDETRLKKEKAMDSKSLRKIAQRERKMPRPKKLTKEELRRIDAQNGFIEFCKNSYESKRDLDQAKKDAQEFWGVRYEEEGGEETS